MRGHTVRSLGSFGALGMFAVVELCWLRPCRNPDGAEMALPFFGSAELAFTLRTYCWPNVYPTEAPTRNTLSE